jgi:PBP1b-binding outer membrane lipoprotein LpoB
MRKERFLLSLGLVAVFLASCSSAESPAGKPAVASATPIPVELTAAPIVDLTTTRVGADSLNSTSSAPTMQAVATSRGPNLEAIDPTSVSLASGGVQFVEFFRFT